ncbi:hypothetical protein PYCCODRAFT_1397131 [Trametes coccinea BRFM310]|uniref:F-box domain-containing protein n=1 Tax=Trametes coccinea (strain BRFM310) TaxID=1353009 RepID=A0A1Y2IBF0_TRAC3|nr:hypothetical protein PYCCODRAFT_1397131 [Trametes coccinea BRFM310]
MAGNIPLCHDVVAQIAEHLSPGNEPLSFTSAQDPHLMKKRLKCQQTLARLAQASRAVSSLALDVLWRHVDDIRYLLRVFPACDDDSKQQGFRDLVSEPDWARFQTYAVRVRSLYLGYTSNIHANVWIILARLAGGDPLIPNLERLTGFVVDESSICQTILLSPTIRELELVISQTANAGVVRMLMDSAQSTFFTLDRLTISHACRRYTSQPPMVQFWTFTQLQTLRVTHEVSLTIDELQAFAAFPNLRCLDLKLELVADVDPSSIPPFAQLRDLSLSGEVANIAKFVASTSLPALNSVALSCPVLCADGSTSGPPGRNTMNTWSDFLPMSIRQFRLSVTCTCDSQHHRSKLGNLLERLRLLTELRGLHLTFTPGILPSHMLPNDKLFSLRDAWPELRALKVGTLEGAERRNDHHNSGYRRRYRSISWERRRHERIPRHEPSSPTLSSLAAFANGHPHLRILEVPSLDLRAIPILDQVPILGHALREFRVEKLVFGAPVFECALVLNLLFPHLDLRNARTTTGASTDSDQRDQLLLDGILLGLQAGRTGSHWVHAATLGEYNADALLPTQRHNVRQQLEPAGQNEDSEVELSYIDGGVTPSPYTSHQSVSSDRGYRDRFASYSPVRGRRGVRRLAGGRHSPSYSNED